MMNMQISKAILLYEKQGKKCAYCETIFDGNVECNIDHIIPKSRGGKNTTDNLCLSCLPCNQAKANMTGDEFRAIMTKVKMGIVKREDLGKYAQFLVLKHKFEPTVKEEVLTESLSPVITL